ncbi:SusC/RagA family TonB-linked outer membrane protein [Parabacteroides sp. PF5-6]|uniref:SusC/RagA family TonB-linked outer membrane protein n=1 Tax=Parabacteroides sp. PF5-6 TaxID=1742403 RepID=UPI00240688E2|nr:SusC/RagA family TonB-linked outer membrane protein [Parabacteroides sp. PF5-6]
MRFPLVMLLAISFTQTVSASALAEEKVSETAQQSLITIRGTVADAHGEPIIGANVFEKGTTRGSITDIDGGFSFSANPNGTLVVSYVGFVTQEIPIRNHATIHITLNEDAYLLDEAVVIGYGTMQKKQVTSSISSLKGDELLKGVGGSTVASALIGKITGLVLHESSSVNSGADIQLRGMGSINAATSPLVVIDGMPGADLRSVLPEDIASIDVLKDASAGAIYGTRATNGVILITTKGAENTGGKARLTYVGEAIYKQPTNKPDLLSAEEYVAHNRGTNYGSAVDWWDESLNTNKWSQRHVVTLQAGGEAANIYASMSYEDMEGVKKFDSSQRYSGRVNANFKLLDGWLEIKTHADYRQNSRGQYSPNFMYALGNNPTRSPYDPDSQTGYNVWLNETLEVNTIANAALNTNEGLDKWFKPDATVKVNILAVPGLSATQTVGYENRQWEQHQWDSKYSKGQLEDGRTGWGRMAFSKEEYLNTEGYLNYVNSFGDHTINATAGYNYWEKNKESFDMENWNFTNELVQFWNMGEGKFLKSGEAKMGSNKDISQKLMSYFARVNYAYKDKYMVMATIRRDGSSKFAVNNRWGNFWSLSGGWRISEESFMQDIPWVNDLKLRAGYGVVGDNDFDASYSANMYGSDTYWLLPSGAWANSYGSTRNINPDLKWEEQKEWNIGLDYSLFDNRIYGKFDIYERERDGIIFEVQVPQPPYTQQTMHKNIGVKSEKGWEFEIGADIVRSKDWNYTMNVGLSRSKGKIETLWGDQSYFNKGGFPSPGTPGDAFRIEEGSKIGQFHLWKFAGFDDEGNWLLYNAEGEVIPASQKKYEDKYHVGDYTPDLFLNWNHAVSYKDFDLSVSLVGAFGQDIYNAVDMYYGIANVGNLNVLKKAYGEYAHIKGEKELSDFFLQDGSYLKIQNINLGYTFNLKKYAKMLDRARLYLSINNVYTFTGYDGNDPSTVKTSGLDNGIDWHQQVDNTQGLQPLARSFTMGLQFNF